MYQNYIGNREINACLSSKKILLIIHKRIQRTEWNNEWSGGLWKEQKANKQTNENTYNVHLIITLPKKIHIEHKWPSVWFSDVQKHLSHYQSVCLFFTSLPSRTPVLFFFCWSFRNHTHNVNISKETRKNADFNIKSSSGHGRHKRLIWEFSETAQWVWQYKTKKSQRLGKNSNEKKTIHWKKTQ